MKKYLKYGIMGILAAIVSFLFLKPEKKEVRVQSEATKKLSSREY